jgi:hypothetical protein
MTAGRMGPVGAKPAVATFTPTDLANLSIWFDASDASSFTYSSGVVVSQWNDKSGNARHASQANTGFQPSRNGTVNGLTTVVFDGTSDRFTIANQTTITTGTAWSVFAVVKPSSLSGARLIIDADSSPRVAQFLRTNGTAAESIAFNTGGSAFNDGAGATLSTGTAYQITSVCTGTAIEAWVDNSSNGSTAVTGTVRTTSGLTAAELGNGAGGSAWWAGDICEVILYDRALNSTDRQTVQSYLKNKWGTA